MKNETITCESFGADGGMMQNSQAATRIEFIDISRAIAMIFVVLGHINFANAGIKDWLYAFHMPVFFIISGLVFQIKENYCAKDFLSNVKKTITRLVVPYFVWGMIFCDFSFQNIIRICYGSYNTISVSGTLSSLWFLNVLSVSLIMIHLLVFVFNGHIDKILSVIVAILLMFVGFTLPTIDSGYPWGINIAFVASGFIITGYICAPMVFGIDDWLFGKKDFFKIFIAIALLVILFTGTCIYRFNVPTYGYILMGNAIYGNPLVFVIVSLLGSAMTVLLGMMISACKSTALKKILVFIGQNSITILMTHKVFITIFGEVFELYPVFKLLELISTCAGTMIICCFIALIINFFAPGLVGNKSVTS